MRNCLKYILLFWVLIFSTSFAVAQIAIPVGVSNLVTSCGTNNFSASVTPASGATGVEWFSDYLCTTSLGSNGTYNGTAATSTMIYAKSTNGGSYSADPKQVYVFKPQIPTTIFPLIFVLTFLNNSIYLCNCLLLTLSVAAGKA